MELTEEQKAEIRDYIVDVPRYRETYDELYDHILNALQELPGSYHLNEVIAIINQDFGSFSEIVIQEEIYQKTLTRKYIKMFRTEMWNTFKWPGILGNLSLLALCWFIFRADVSRVQGIRFILVGMGAVVILIALWGYAHVFIRKRRYSKRSILDNFLLYQTGFGLTLLNAFLQLFISKYALFPLRDDFRYGITLLVVCFCFIYMQVMVKFFKQKLKILGTA